MEITYQKLKQLSSDAIGIAEKYFSIIAVLNDLHLTEREIQLLAFSGVKGNLSNANVREEFCKRYDTSFPTISNMISKLKKLNIIVKENGKIHIVPILSLNFKNDIVLQIHLAHEDINS